MKRILLFFLMGVSTSTYSQAPCPEPILSYVGYHIKWEDDFNYNQTTFQSDATFNQNWLLPDDMTVCQGSGGVWVKTSQITMPSPGVIRLTEEKLPGTLSCNSWQGNKTHISGWLYSKRYVSTGIIEAKIKIPDDQGLTGNEVPAFPSFWIPEHRDQWTVPSYTEVDILDNWHGSNTKIISALYNHPNWAAPNAKTHAHFQEKNISSICYPVGYTPITDLSDDYYIYSCLWTPSRVTIYLNRRYVTHFDYKDGRTVPDFQNLLIILQAKPTTKDGLSMDVDWVKYWVQDCSPSGIVIDPNNQHPSFMNYPILPPDYSKDPQFESLKYETILMNGGYPTPIETDNTLATVVEADATTILPGFIADQSVSNWTSIVTAYDTNTGNPIYDSGPIDGYFLIKSVKCSDFTGYDDHDNDGGGDPPVEKPSPINRYSNTSIEVHPNPATASIKVDGIAEGSSYLIVDIRGRAVQQGNLVNNNIDVSKLGPGSYSLILVEHNRNKTYRKFIKL